MGCRGESLYRRDRASENSSLRLPSRSDLVSPSGHTSLSTLIYGALALVIAAETRGWQHVTAPAAAQS